MARIVPSRRYWQFLFHRAARISRPADRRRRSRTRAWRFASFSVSAPENFKGARLVFPFFFYSPRHPLFSTLNRVRIALYRVRGIQIDSRRCARISRRFLAWKRNGIANRSLVVRAIATLALLFSLSLCFPIKCTQFRYAIKKNLVKSNDDEFVEGDRIINCARGP